jgi:hypothetical protein
MTPPSRLAALKEDPAAIDQADIEAAEVHDIVAASQFG